MCAVVVELQLVSYLWASACYDWSALDEICNFYQSLGSLAVKIGKSITGFHAVRCVQTQEYLYPMSTITSAGRIA